jgi:hypothetical protein
MSFCTKAITLQLKTCERAAITDEEAKDCQFWREWIEAGRREQELRGGGQVVNFATAAPAPLEEGRP